MSVIFINLFDVPAGRGEAFLAEWQKVNDYMRNQPGYQGHQLHRALAGDAKYQYVNVATWESAEAWRAAHDDGFLPPRQAAPVARVPQHPGDLRGRARRRARLPVTTGTSTQKRIRS